MYKYKIHSLGTKTIILEKDGFLISFVDPSLGNTEYEKYLKWVAEGNVAEEWKPNGN